MPSSCSSTDSYGAYDAYDSDAYLSSPRSDNSGDLDLDGTLVKYSYFYTAAPFNLTGRTFEELPEATRQFLNDNIMKLLQQANRFDESSESSDTNTKEPFNDNITIDIQTTVEELYHQRRNRLERTLEGVNRAIVKEILGSHTRTGDGTLDTHCMAFVGDVLQPEWKEHLDHYVQEVDALIWLEMVACHTTRETSEVYMKERMKRVEAMIRFALRCLQNALDDVKMENRTRLHSRELTLDGCECSLDGGDMTEITIGSDDEMHWVKIE